MAEGEALSQKFHTCKILFCYTYVQLPITTFRSMAITWGQITHRDKIKMETLREETGSTRYSQLGTNVGAIHILPADGQANMVLFARNTAQTPVVHQALQDAGVESEMLPPEPILLRVAVTDSKDFPKALTALAEKGIIEAETAETLKQELPTAIQSAQEGKHPEPEAIDFEEPEAIDFEKLPSAKGRKFTWVEREDLDRSDREPLLHGPEREEYSKNSPYGDGWPTVDDNISVMSEESAKADALLDAAYKKGGEKALERLDDMNLRGTDLLIALEAADGDIDKLLKISENPPQEFCDQINGHANKIRRESVVPGGAVDARMEKERDRVQGCRLI